MGIRAFDVAAEVRIPWDRCAPAAIGAAGRWASTGRHVRTEVAAPHLGETCLHLSIRITGVRALALSGAHILACNALWRDLVASGILADGQEPTAVNVHIEEAPGGA